MTPERLIEHFACVADAPDAAAVPERQVAE